MAWDIRLQKSSNVAFKFALLFSVVVILIVSIPLFFYASLAIKHTEFTQRQELIDQSFALKQKFYSIKEGTGNFVYPRSLLFGSAILDEHDHAIFSLVDFIPAMVEGEFVHFHNQLFYKTTLEENPLGARYLIVSKNFSYNVVLIDFLMLLGVVLVLIFVSSFWILRRSIEPFEKANHYMDTFFKDAMHELKTPLGIIQLNLEILREKLGSHKGFDRANAALKVLVTLFEDIEYFIKNQHIEYLPACTALSDFLHERIDYFSDIAQTKEISFERQIQEGVWVEINRMELQRILDNTFSNALKYTNPKKSIKTRLYYLDQEKKRVVLEVEDEGIGIKDTHAIFGRYYRGDNIRGGFGIGLSIVKNICEKYGIIISVRSHVGHGSVFSYTFPVTLAREGS